MSDEWQKIEVPVEVHEVFDKALKNGWCEINGKRFMQVKPCPECEAYREGTRTGGCHGKCKDGWALA